MNDCQSLIEDGFTFLPELRPNATTISVAESLGVVASIPSMPTVYAIRPRLQHEAPRNVYSGNFGLGPFPFHTDLAHWHMPPRYILLRCLHPAAQVCTPVLHQEIALTGISSIAVRRALYQPRRKLDGRSSLLRLIQTTKATSLFRWDDVFLNPANEEAIEVANRLRSIQPERTGVQIFLKKRGDTLLLDNWSVLHGRSGVPGNSVNRLIERVYLTEVRL